MTSPGIAWLVMAVALATATLASLALPPLAIDWQPHKAWQEPWRWWSAAFVHYSPFHLGANLAATLLVGAYGWAARASPGATLAWLLAWPLTHLALIGQTELQHYGGLSGLMHAGIAIANVHLVAKGDNRLQQAIGAIGLVLLVAKVIAETPLRAAVQHSPDWDIPIAPIAHLSGLACGLVLGLLSEMMRRSNRRTAPAAP